MKKKVTLKQASLIKRALAFVIDWYVSALMMSAVVILIHSLYYHTYNSYNHIIDLPVALAFFTCLVILLIYIGYFLILPLKMKQQTIGKRIMHIQMVSDDGQTVSLKQLILRYTIYLLLEQSFTNAAMYWKELLCFWIPSDYVAIGNYITAGICVVSLIHLFVAKDRKMLHDLLAHTMVIE